MSLARKALTQGLAEMLDHYKTVAASGSKGCRDARRHVLAIRTRQVALEQSAPC